MWPLRLCLLWRGLAVSEPELKRWIPHMRPRSMHPGELQELRGLYRHWLSLQLLRLQEAYLPQFLYIGFLHI